MAQSHPEYIQWLLKLMNQYGIKTKDLSAISLVGMNMHVLADLYDTTNFYAKQAIKEGHVITAKRLDSLYKHAREVDLFPTLSIPATMKFVLVINESDFDKVAQKRNNEKFYTLSKKNYITVGEFIYSLDYDIDISIKDVNDSDDILEYSATAKYVIDDSLPKILRTSVNPLIKATRRKTQRGWELHLYLELKQYAREIYEREFIDRDYSAFNYTANAELVSMQAYRLRSKTQTTELPITELDLKFYFENSRTSKDSIYVQFESPQSFTLIHKSQENGFRPLTGDRLITHIYTTAGTRGNFTYSITAGDSIKFVADDDTDLDVQVILLDGESKGGSSYTNDKEILRREIITKRSTRDSIITENDLLMHIRNAARSNDHFVIKNRNDIKKIFNVFTTLKYGNGPNKVMIPANTIDVIWDFDGGYTGESTASLVYTENEFDGKTTEKHFNNTTFMVECTQPGVGRLISPTQEDLLIPLMEEIRLGVYTPKYYKSTDGETMMEIGGGADPLPVIDANTKYLTKNRLYYYNGKLLRYKGKGEDETEGPLNPGEALNIVNDLNHTSRNKELLYFTEPKAIHYWLPYFLSYIRSKTKNFIRAYEQTADRRYILDYKLLKESSPISYICNWMNVKKSSIFNELGVNINIRNNLTDTPLTKFGYLEKLDNGNVLDTGKVQVFLELKDNKDKLVYTNRFVLNEYINIEADDDDFMDMVMTILPAGYIPRIVNNKMSAWSELEQRWVEIPLTNLKASVKVYDLTSAPDSFIEGKKFIDGENGEPVEITLYKTLDIHNSIESDKYLINQFDTDCELLREVTDLYKLQHKVNDVNKLTIFAVPLVQYTFYKYFANFYHKAIEDELHILKYIPKFQGEFSLALKYTNTYGYSSTYAIGKNKRPLHNTQVYLSFLVRKKHADTVLDTAELSNAVAKYIESVDFTKFEKFHISKLYDYLFDQFRSKIEFIEFKGMNGEIDDNQLIQMKIDKIENDTIIERINIPYIYKDGFQYKVDWQITAPEEGVK